jgi:hypothetical protein
MTATTQKGLSEPLKAHLVSPYHNKGLQDFNALNHNIAIDESPYRKQGYLSDSKYC